MLGLSELAGGQPIQLACFLPEPLSQECEVTSQIWLASAGHRIRECACECGCGVSKPEVGHLTSLMKLVVSH